MEKKQYKKDFIRYAFINVIAMLGLSCYILADTFFISRGLGANGLTALNLAIPIFNFISGTGLMLGMGGATKYAILVAQNEKKRANRIFTNTIYIAAIISILYVFIGFFYSERIAVRLGANTEVLEMTNTYLKVSLLFAPAFILNNILICFMRNDGNPKLAMIASLSGSFSNVILDYLFIFPFKMGIFGAVFATGLAPIISIIVILPYLLRGKQQFSLDLRKPDKAIAATIFMLGIPSLIVEISSGIVVIIFNIIILRIAGNVGVAAYGVITNLSLVVIAICTGVAQGMQPITSKAYGSGNMKMAKYIFSLALKLTCIMTVVIYCLTYIFANPIAGIFNNEGNLLLQEIAVKGLRLYFIGMLFAGINVVMSMYFSSTERIVPAHTITLLRGIIIIIPVAFILSTLIGLTGTWISFPATEFIVLMIGIVFLARNRRKIESSEKV